jgi:ABC-2 type transport system permease protein
MNQTRPLYWSIRRELWENRAIFVAPLATAAVILVGYLIGSFHLPRAARSALAETTRHSAGLDGPFAFAAVAIMAVGWLVSIFYCLAALQAERRDRSILFWKSLPVSDLTVVASKAAVPFIIVPAVVLATAVATQMVMLIWGSVVLLLNNINPGVLWRHQPLLWNAFVMSYVLVCATLWNAPFWGWLLLVSGWARRMAFLWAVGPIIGLTIFARMAFNSDSAYGRFLGERYSSGLSRAFGTTGHGEKAMPDFDRLDPIRFLTTPGLWVGLIVAAAFLAAAVWLRRRREPI